MWPNFERSPKGHREEQRRSRKAKERFSKPKQICRFSGTGTCTCKKASKQQNWQKSDIEDMQGNLDELEQYSHKNSLEFHGIPEDAGIPTDEIVCKVAQAVGVEMEPVKNRDFTSLTCKPEKKESNQWSPNLQITRTRQSAAKRESDLKMFFFFSIINWNNSKGVWILVNPSIVVNVENSYKDIDGRIIATDVMCNGVNLSICNLYAPTNCQSQENFLQILIKHHTVNNYWWRLECYVRLHW